MTKKDWKRLLREAKNDGDYHILMTCLKGYVKQYPHQCSTIYQFYNNFNFQAVRSWYKEQWNYERYYKLIYGV